MFSFEQKFQGIVDQNLHQLHGDLVNCQNPPMECFIDPHEYLIKSRLPVECRLVTDDLFFYDDRSCVFRFYYHRSYCYHENQCYSISMSCLPVQTPTPLTWIIVFAILLLTILIISCISCCIHRIYTKCCKGNKPGDKPADSTSSENQKLEQMYPLIQMEKPPKPHRFSRYTETLI